MKIFNELVLDELRLKHCPLTESEKYQYYSKIGLLSAGERNKLDDLAEEIHVIYSRINSYPTLKNFRSNYENISTILEFHEKVKPVSRIILDVSQGCNIDLKIIHTEKYKTASLNIFGKSYFERKFA